MPPIVAKLVETLTSKKFLAAVASSVPFALAGDWNNFAMVWMGYAGIVGVVDAAHHLTLPSPKAVAVAPGSVAVFPESPSNEALPK